MEIYACLLSKTSGIYEFGFHLPLQISNLPTLLPVCPKSGRKAIFKVFLTLQATQNLSKSLGNLCACIIFDEKSKNTNFSSRGDPNCKRAPSGAMRRAEKSVLRPKISKLTKFFPNFLKFGLSVLHHVPLWAKEASAKIWSLSCLLRRFNALFNFAFRILILALQT